MSEPSELARALAPLRAEYVRRLDEMANRIKPEHFSREPIARTDGGRLVEGEDGFPIRYDVADTNEGYTYEVCSAHDDKPALDRLRVGATEVELLPGKWEALVVTCTFDGDPVEEDAQALASLYRAFHELAWHGGFTPRNSTEPWSGRVHQLKVVMTGSAIAAVFDLGTLPASGLDALLRAIDGFGAARAPVAKVVIGGVPPDPNAAV